MSPSTEAVATLGAVRRILLGILLLGMAGTSADLLLLQHLEDTTQLIPFVLLGAGFGVVGWHLFQRSRLSLTALQLLMVLFVAAGILGMVFHFQANAEFQLEVDPSLAGTSLAWRALQAKTPPALAPAVMVQLGLIGLVYSYRHPAIARRNIAIEESDL